jgi:O-antigen/teichoic acid export membrane protein
LISDLPVLSRLKAGRWQVQPFEKSQLEWAADKLGLSRVRGSILLNPLLNIALNGLRMVISAGSGFAVSVMIARSLGAGEMGIYCFAMWIAGMVASLSSLGLPDAISKYVAEHKGLGRHVLSVRIARKILGLQVIAAAVATAISLAIWGTLEPHRIEIVVLALATVLPSAVQLTLLGLMEGEQRFDLQLVSTLGSSLFQVGVVAIVARNWPSVPGFLGANLLAAIVLLGVTYYFSYSMLDMNPDSVEPAYPEIARKVLTFSLAVYGLWLLQMVVFDKSEMLFLRTFSTPDQLAYYGIAFALVARLGTAGDSISFVLFPMFVTRLAETGEEGLRASYSRSITYLQILMVPICLWVLPLLPNLVQFAYGSQYESVVAVIRILLVTLLFSITMSVSCSVVYALDQQMMLLRFMVPMVALNILLDLLLIPRFAAAGAATANGVSQAAAALGTIAMIRRLLPGSFPARVSMKVYAAGLASCIPVFGVDLFLHAGLVVVTLSVALAVAIYILLLMWMHALSGNEFAMLKASFGGLRLKAAKG